MTLREIFHGRERPFDQVPTTSDYVRYNSLVKTIAVVVGIFASVIAAIGGAVLLPDRVASSAAKGLQAQFDARYVTLVSHKDLIDAEQRSRDEMEKRLDARMDGTDKRLDDTNAMLRTMNSKIDESVGHARFISSTLKGASPMDYEPLPRKVPAK